MAELKRIYYDSGELCSEVFILNGKRHGEFKSYFKNIFKSDIDQFVSQVEEKYTYVDDKKNGEYVCYYKSGKIYNIYTFINDKLYGEYKCYYPSGQLTQICTYDNNEINGECKEYYPSGQLKTISTYVDGKYNGKYVLFYDNKYNDKSMLILKDINYHTTDSFGQIYEIREYVNGVLSGNTTEYYESGKIWNVYKYVNGKINGEYKSYDKNDKLYIIRNFVNNKIINETFI